MSTKIRQFLTVALAGLLLPAGMPAQTILPPTPTPTHWIANAPNSWNGPEQTQKGTPRDIPIPPPVDPALAKAQADLVAAQEQIAADNRYIQNAKAQRDEYSKAFLDVQLELQFTHEQLAAALKKLEPTPTPTPQPAPPSTAKK